MNTKVEVKVTCGRCGHTHYKCGLTAESCADQFARDGWPVWSEPCPACENEPEWAFGAYPRGTRQLTHRHKARYITAKQAARYLDIEDALEKWLHCGLDSTIDDDNKLITALYHAGFGKGKGSGQG